MARSYVYASLPASLVAFAASRGMPPTELLAAARLPPEALVDPEEIVPYECLPRMWRALLDRFQDEPIGLEYAALASAATYGLVGRLCIHSSTFAEGLDHYLRFYRLLDPMLVVDMTKRQDEVEVTIAHEARTIAMEEPMEMIVGAMTRTMREEYPTLPPLTRVRFQHARRHAEHVYVRFFGAAVEFDAPNTSVTFPSGALDCRSDGADPQLSRYLASHAQTLMQSVPPEDAWLARLRRALEAKLLHGEVPNEKESAETLGMSVRTLQRRLHQKELTFTQLIDEARKELAFVMLESSERSIEEVTFRLGFTDSSAFRRACRRWTSQTPSQLRQKLRSA